MLFTRLNSQQSSGQHVHLKKTKQTINQNKFKVYSANHYEAYSNRYCHAKFVYKSLNQNEQIMNKEMPVVPC